MSVDELIGLWRKTTLYADNSWKWTDLDLPDGDDIYPYVAQGSRLGDTLIAFDDNYEDAGHDALFIQELIEHFADFVKWREGDK